MAKKMNYNNIFLLTFTETKSHDGMFFPVEFCVSEVNSDFSEHGTIKPNPNWKNWCFPPQQQHGISERFANNKGMETRDVCKKINDIAYKNGIKTFYSADYKTDVKLCSDMFTSSIIRPAFEIKDFYSNINEYQIKLWNHLYVSFIKDGQKLTGNSAYCKNYFIKKCFETIIKIHQHN